MINWVFDVSHPAVSTVCSLLPSLFGFGFTCSTDFFPPDSRSSSFLPSVVLSDVLGP